MRRAARRDAVERRIVAALRKAGVWVARISTDGLPDLLCFTWQLGYKLLEVKRPGGKLTPAQTRWLNGWPGPVEIVHDEIEALRVMGKIA